MHLWNSWEKSLPESDVEVLSFSRQTDAYAVAEFSPGRWLSDNDLVDWSLSRSVVSHWTDLPSPPQ